MTTYPLSWLLNPGRLTLSVVLLAADGVLSVADTVACSVLSAAGLASCSVLLVG